LKREENDGWMDIDQFFGWMDWDTPYFSTMLDIGIQMTLSITIIKLECSPTLYFSSLLVFIWTCCRVIEKV
jgi:hypothetical protein